MSPRARGIPRVQAGSLPAELVERLKVEAARRDMGKNRMLEIAVERQLEVWEAQDIEGMIARWREDRTTAT